MVIMRGADGHARYVTLSCRWDSSTPSYFSTVGSYKTNANVTSIRIATCGAGNIGSGTKIIMFRIKG